MIRLGLVGFGKIARDQHVPAIAATRDFELVAVADPSATVDGVSSYADLDTMLANHPGIDAVILCQPPQPRFAAARTALLAGKHVFLEKPPGATLTEVEALIGLAQARGVSLFASWHSREAAAVPLARQWLADAAIKSVSVTWKEDVQVWHPGQSWIWETGGFGVFDPGINALSILTEILAEPVRLVGAVLTIPRNKAAPIAAVLALETLSGAPVEAEFDFRQTGPQSWDIAIECDKGKLLLSHGGNALAIDGIAVVSEDSREYPRLYERFAEAIAAGSCDADLSPLRLVADAFLIGRTCPTEPFLD